MEHIPLLDELAVIAGLGALVSVVLARFRLPTVAGLLFVGAVVGPFGLALVRSLRAIEILSEIGVVLLLFTIGLEFSLGRMRAILRQVVVGGSIQVGLTIAGVGLVAVALGRSVGTSLFYGCVFALSSTAIVLRALAERREIDAPHGRFIVGALIFQDLCVVPMVLVVPLLAPGQHVAEATSAIGLALAKAVALVAAVLFVSRAVVPRAFAWVAAARSREVFLLAVLTVCIGTAWLTSLAGLSLALGAFLGGMVVADTEYGHTAMADVRPLRDAFVSVFFVSLGMLFDVRVILAQPLLVGLLLAGFLFFKGFLATVAALVMGFPSRVAWLAGVGLAQFGEFGFVLARLAQANGVVDANEVSSLLAAGILSMFLTPVLVRAAPHVSAGESLLAPLEKLLGVRGIDQAAAETENLENHVVLVGFGVAGRLLAAALSRSGLQWVALELNPDTVREHKAAGAPIYYGDASSPEALFHAGIERASALVLLMNDPQAARHVVAAARSLAPDLPILVRSHYLFEKESLEEAGATELVTEEVEAGVEMLARVLRRLEVPRNVIEERLEEARDLTEPATREIRLATQRLGGMRSLGDLAIECVRLPEESPARTVRSLDLQHRTGALIVAVRRGETLLEPPDPDEPLQAGDLVYLVGSPAAIERASGALTTR